MVNKKGFTLIELLVVVAILAILATVVFVALNPVKRFADARNARRFMDADSILTAIHMYSVDNNGIIPIGIGLSEQQLGTCVSGGNTPCTNAATACLNIGGTLAAYLKSIPTDPNGGTSLETFYSVVKDANNIVTVKACNAEVGTTVQISR